MILDPFYLQVSNFKRSSSEAGAEVVPPVSSIDEDVSLWVPFKWGRFVPIPRMRRYIYPFPIRPIDEQYSSGSNRVYWPQKKKPFVETQPSPVPPAMLENEEALAKYNAAHNTTTEGGVVVFPTPFMIPYKDIKKLLKEIMKAIKRRKYIIEDYLRNLYAGTSEPSTSESLAPYNETKEKQAKLYSIEPM